MAKDKSKNGKVSHKTLKKDIFAQAMIMTGDEKKAMDVAKYAPTRVQLKRLREDGYVQRRIEELLEEKYPQFEEEYVQMLRNMIAVAGTVTDPKDLKYVVQVADHLATIKDYKAPTKHARLEKRVNAKDLLPK